jgi:endonuclease/exonuclease/phosphatase family metal-dependent hydrolase
VNLRLLSYNIRYGGIGREKFLADVIAGCAADIVVLQEASQPEVVKRLAAACKMSQFAAMAGHSLAFLSRVPIASHVWHHPRLAKRAYLEIALPGDGLRIFGVHLAAIHSNITEQRRVYELKALLQNIARQKTGFHVIVGDYNTLAPGEQLDVARLPLRLRALVWVSGGAIRWQTIQLMIDGGYLDGYQKLHPGDPGFTFPTGDPHIRLDYLFLPKADAARLQRCDVQRNLAAAEASDHFPLLSEISLP